MIRYKCTACGGNQYSVGITSSPCIYCGNPVTEAQETLESEERKNELRIQQKKSND